jgi:hypothetical protein
MFLFTAQGVEPKGLPAVYKALLHPICPQPEAADLGSGQAWATL